MFRKRWGLEKTGCLGFVWLTSCLLFCVASVSCFPFYPSPEFFLHLHFFSRIYLSLLGFTSLSGLVARVTIRSRQLLCRSRSRSSWSFGSSSGQHDDGQIVWWGRRGRRREQQGCSQPASHWNHLIQVCSSDKIKRTMPNYVYFYRTQVRSLPCFVSSHIFNKTLILPFKLGLWVADL